MADHPMNIDLDMKGNKITDVAAPSAGTDATNKTYVDNAVTASDTIAGNGLTESPVGTFNVGNTDTNLVIGANSVDFSAGAAAVIAAGPAAAYTAGGGLTDSPLHTFNVANTDGNLVVGANSVDLSAGAAAVIAAGPAATYTAGAGLTDSPLHTFNVANTDGYIAVTANSVDLSAGAAAVIAAGPAATYTAGAGLSNSPTGTFNVTNSDANLTIGADVVNFSAGAAAVITAGPAPALAGSAPPLVTSGGASSTGVATSAARTDHTHGLTIASSAPPLVASDSASVVGVATTPARSDHTHGLTMASVAPPVINTSGTSTLGAATTPARSDHTHGLALATTSVQGAMSATDKARITNFFDAGFYNVVDWGVTTANSGATNLTNINTLLTAATANSIIYFPASTSSYQFSGQIQTSAKAFRFLGAGQSKSIIQTNHATEIMFLVGANGTEFMGLRFGATVTRTQNAAIQSGNFTNVNVYDCYFDSMFLGVEFSGGANCGIDCFVDNCFFSATDIYAITVRGPSSTVRVTNCAGTCTSGVTNAYIQLIESASFTMDDCRWKNAVNNMRIDPESGTLAVRNVAVSNTIFESATGSAVKTFGSAAGVLITGVKFSNCGFNTSGGHGMEIGSSTATVKPASFKFVNCDFNGNSNNGLHALAVQDFSVSNCLMAGNTNQGIEVSASSGSVTKFEISNCTIGAGGGLAANGVGMLINAGTYGGYVISNNLITGNVQAISDSGSVTTTDLKKVINNGGHLIQGAIATNRGAATSGTAETLLLNARIPGGPSVKVGQTFRFTVIGQTDNVGTLIFRVRAGAVGTVAGDTTVINLQDTTAAQVANGWQKYEGLINIVTVSGSGTVGAAGWVTAGALVTGQAAAAETLATVNMNNAFFLDITAACAVAGTFTVRYAVIELL